MPICPKGAKRSSLPRCLPLLLFLALALRPVSARADGIPWQWNGVERVVAVADLHGDYERFVFILSNVEVGILDPTMRWAGGKTHLVQLGDIMDRGPDAKRIFDLLMRLEKEAAAAGGMVHVLLGNHEEMNITGIALGYPGYVTVEQFVSFLPEDFKRAKDAKYIASLSSKERKLAQEKGFGLADDGYRAFWQQVIDNKDPEALRAYVLGLNEPYGDWLLRKNSIIKINDVIYTHGGVSEPLSKWPIVEVNSLIRRELAFFQGRMRNPQRFGGAFKPKLVYDKDSPLWFRGFVETNEQAAQAEIDRILANLHASAMVTGHNYASSRLNGSSPIIDKTSVSRFHDKYWNMDTGISQFYGGIPSALINEGGAMRVWGETEEVAARSVIKPIPTTEPISASELEKFLLTAPIKKRTTGPAGRTEPWRIILESDGTVRQAIFKYIDRRRPDLLPDSYKYELAAYALSRYLGLGLVPPAVERRIEGVTGSLQAFVENSIPESERQARKIKPVDPARFAAGMSDLRVFENLVYDDCRNEQDILVGRDDSAVSKVDFSEAFAPKRDTPPRCPVLRCSRRLFLKLQAWDEAAVTNLLRPYLNDEELRALHARREIIARVLQRLVQIRGEDGVLY